MRALILYVNLSCACLNIPDEYIGVTALFYAAMIGDGATVAMLVSQGARVNLYAQPKPPSAVRVPTDQILDPTHKALLGGVELEPELAVCNTPAHAATVQGHFRVVLFLVQQGADVSQVW